MFLLTSQHAYAFAAWQDGEVDHDVKILRGYITTKSLRGLLLSVT